MYFQNHLELKKDSITQKYDKYKYIWKIHLLAYVILISYYFLTICKKKNKDFR